MANKGKGWTAARIAKLEIASGQRTAPSVQSWHPRQTAKSTASSRPLKIEPKEVVMSPAEIRRQVRLADDATRRRVELAAERGGAFHEPELNRKFKAEATERARQEGLQARAAAIRAREAAGGGGHPSDDQPRDDHGRWTEA